METLVRSGKPLTVFSVKENDLKKFVQEAKRYGILYCAVRDPKGSRDGIVDIMVKEEDAPRINRIVERFQFASVAEAAQIKTEIQKAREEESFVKGKVDGAKAEVTESSSTQEADRKKTDSSSEHQRGYTEKQREEKLLDELFGSPAKKEEKKQKNPSLAKTEKSHLSEPISEIQKKSAKGTSKPCLPVLSEKHSVRKELNKIQTARKKEADAPKWEKEFKDNKIMSREPLQHTMPMGKRKSGKIKER